MNKKYLLLLAKEFPTIDSAVSEIVNLSAIRSLPKGTEYFFSDIHGEYEAFLHMLKSASCRLQDICSRGFSLYPYRTVCRLSPSRQSR